MNRYLLRLKLYADVVAAAIGIVVLYPVLLYSSDADPGPLQHVGVLAWLWTALLGVRTVGPVLI